MVLGFYLMSVGLGEYLDPRKRLVRLTADAGEEAQDDDPRKEEVAVSTRHKDDVWAP